MSDTAAAPGAVRLMRLAVDRMRAENPTNDNPTRCHCEDDGARFTDHWFDRSICPEPCNSMHDVCVECARVKGYCAVAISSRGEGNRRARSWRAVADWLEAEAQAHTHDAAGAIYDIWALPGMDRHPALLLARTYLGGGDL